VPRCYPRRIATISVHTSPLEQPGTGDAGGLNVYVVEVAKRMAARGVEVDIFTRAVTRDAPPVAELVPGVLVRHVPAGPFEDLDKGDLPAQLCALTSGLLRVEAQHEPGYFDVVHSHYWLSGQVGWLATERWDVPLRLFAAVHYLVLTGEAPDALSGRFEDFAAALARHEDALRARIETHGVQTNEVQRCTMLLPTLLAASAETGLPLELVELGPSAGLNLLVDRYRYRYAHGTFGPGDALVELAVEEHGGRVPASLLGRELVVRRNAALVAPPELDVAPVGLALGRFLVRQRGCPAACQRYVSAAPCSFCEPVGDRGCHGVGVFEDDELDVPAHKSPAASSLDRSIAA